MDTGNGPTRPSEPTRGTKRPRQSTKPSTYSSLDNIEDQELKSPRGSKPSKQTASPSTASVHDDNRPLQSLGIPVRSINGTDHSLSGASGTNDVNLRLSSPPMATVSPCQPVVSVPRVSVVRQETGNQELSRETAEEGLPAKASVPETTARLPQGFTSHETNKKEQVLPPRPSEENLSEVVGLRQMVKIFAPHDEVSDIVTPWVSDVFLGDMSDETLHKMPKNASGLYTELRTLVSFLSPNTDLSLYDLITMLCRQLLESPGTMNFASHRLFQYVAARLFVDESTFRDASGMDQIASNLLHLFRLAASTYVRRYLFSEYNIFKDLDASSIPNGSAEFGRQIRQSVFVQFLLSFFRRLRGYQGFVSKSNMLKQMNNESIEI
eukprot:Nitzschia sp. Nitz4//scaffold17_size182527//103903//105311//NITZ4_001862-RA/size182527-snap-gene-0.282-mRNA-1//1//CDS//3329539364//2655//frame0